MSEFKRTADEPLDEVHDRASMNWCVRKVLETHAREERAEAFAAKEGDAALAESARLSDALAAMAALSTPVSPPSEAPLSGEQRLERVRSVAAHYRDTSRPERDTAEAALATARAAAIEECAAEAETRRRAPMTDGGGCVECGKWIAGTRPGQSDNHVESCAAGRLEHEADPGMARAIRALSAAAAGAAKGRGTP